MVSLPVAKPGSTKYGTTGLYTENSFKNLAVSTRWKKALAETANFALAKKSWSSYTTAAKMLQKCAADVGETMDYPLKEGNVLTFIAWMINRELSASTMESYLAGIRQVHLINGVALPILRTPLVKQLLEGQKHIDALARRLNKKPVRLPVTPNVLKLLKLEIFKSDLTRERKLLMWSVSTLAFAGAFRIHELLARQERVFDPNFTLLSRDIKIKELNINGEKVQILQVRLKSEKTDRIGADTIVDVYKSGGPLCPIRAFNKWSSIKGDFGGRVPAFLDNNGTPLTGRKFNELLKSFLGKHLDYKKGGISSHSFRAGITSMVAKLGFSEEEMQALGRWSSAAYNAYIKLPRTRRLQMAKNIGALGL